MDQEIKIRYITDIDAIVETLIDNSCSSLASENKFHILEVVKTTPDINSVFDDKKSTWWDRLPENFSGSARFTEMNCTVKQFISLYKVGAEPSPKNVKEFSWSSRQEMRNILQKLVNDGFFVIEFDCPDDDSDT